MKQQHTYLLLCLVALLAACQSENELPTQQPDGYGTIQFSVAGTQKAITRVSTEYRDWEESSDPASMGVFGYHDLLANDPIFDNVEFTPEATTNIWKTIKSLAKYWGKYSTANNFDFFGYMPYQVKAMAELPGANLVKADDADSYTLSLPFAFEDGTWFSTDTRKIPLLCKEPGKKPKSDYVVDMKFDQTLTGYALKFKLGEKMDKVRDITITKVRLYGDNFLTGGTVSRTYTLNSDPQADARWTVGDIVWSDLNKLSLTGEGEGQAFVVEHVNGEGEASLLLNSTAFQQWGQTLYTIPQSIADFHPTIEVTYTVRTNTTEGSVVTRQNVVSKIELNKTNFDKYTGGKADEINTLNILIVPSYLYVLADEDQHAGVIVIP